MNKKTRNKIILVISFVIIGFIAVFFFSNFVFLIIEDKEIELMMFLPHLIIKSIKNNTFHFMLFIVSNLFIIMCAFLIINHSGGEYFTSELDDITDTIKTPKSVGQMQHGSSRWLQKNEYDKVFASHLLNENNTSVASLIKGGNSDKNEISRDSKEIGTKEREST